MGKKRFGKNKNKNPNKEPVRAVKRWQELVKENESFVNYYKAQNLMSDDEFEQFMATLREPLPAAFRINSSCFGQTQALKNIVESDEFSDVLDKEGKNKKGITKLKWFPTGLAYQLNLSRFEIRDDEKLLKLHGFLINEAENGYITRQETVSFIPPIVLDIQPYHSVLDLCAAPGSKTTQIIEILHAGKSLGVKDEGEKQGFVVANDLNNDRCYMLVHQCKLYNLPYFLVTNEDASRISDFLTVNKETGEKEKFKFDRVLADVPCSGDGTLRKNNDIWSKWNPNSSNNLYFLQSRIAKRAAELLKKDGLMVYSTCSMNPVEDEVVVMNLLRQADGGLELVDVEKKVEHLKYSKGLEKWALMQKNLKIVNSFDEVEKSFRNQLLPEMFPPDDVEKYNLKRCMRILPHLQNTGGFFVSVIRKTTDHLPWENEDKDETSEPKPKKPRGLDKRAIGFREEPFVFVTKDNPEWLKLKENYSISDDFPSHRLFYRSEKGSSHFHYVVDSAIDMFNNSADKIKFINFGVRLFSRIQDKVSNCSHRIAQDGLGVLYPYLAKERIISISIKEFEKLLKCEEYLDLNTNEIDQSTIDAINKFPSGCVILECKIQVKQDDGTFEELKLPITAWKGKSTIRPFVNKNERIHYNRICGFDLSNLDKERKKILDDRKQRKIERLARCEKAKLLETKDHIDVIEKNEENIQLNEMNVDLPDK